MSLLRNQKGLTLIEMVASIGILSVALEDRLNVGLTKTAIRSARLLNDAKFAKGFAA